MIKVQLFNGRSDLVHTITNQCMTFEEVEVFTRRLNKTLEGDEKLKPKLVYEPDKEVSDG